ncbi:MAG: hypothetical protein EOO70_05515 [Myxococcaceae bacterium]|nr:MAG: hypothetical protein EOO70_05515 [Myxococcaceae bacterium]
MPKPKSPPTPTESPTLVQINLRLPPEFLEAIDACVEAANRADPFKRINRSDFIREAMAKAVREAQPTLPKK